LRSGGRAYISHRYDDLEDGEYSQNPAGEEIPILRARSAKEKERGHDQPGIRSRLSCARRRPL
jgi:hypothetical protein